MCAQIEKKPEMTDASTEHVQESKTIGVGSEIEHKEKSTEVLVAMKNKETSARPKMMDKALENKPQTFEVGIKTELVFEKPECLAESFLSCHSIKPLVLSVNPSDSLSQPAPSFKKQKITQSGNFMSDEKTQKKPEMVDASTEYL